jgi:hypothetical protein
MSESRSKYDAGRGVRSPEGDIYLVRNERWNHWSILRLSPGVVKGNLRHEQASPGGEAAALKGGAGANSAGKEKIRRVSLSSKPVSLLGKFAVAERGRDTYEK